MLLKKLNVILNPERHLIEIFDSKTGRIIEHIRIYPSYKTIEAYIKIYLPYVTHWDYIDLTLGEKAI